MNNKITEIREALEKASTQHEWDTDGRFIQWKDGHPLKGTYRQIAITHAPVAEAFNNENHENDAYLLANAPGWLQYLLDEHTRLTESLKGAAIAANVAGEEITALREELSQQQEVSHSMHKMANQYREEWDKFREEAINERELTESIVTEREELIIENEQLREEIERLKGEKT